jgi:cytochrome c553
MRLRPWSAFGLTAALTLVGGCDDSDDGKVATADAAAVIAVDAAVSPDEAAPAIPDANVVDDVAAVADASADLAAGRAAYRRPKYQHLSETGLFGETGDVDAGAPATLAPDLLRFRPTHTLWSDGAQKDRLVRLPPGSRIDTSDMDHWTFPIGTQVWKEFARDGVKLETRLIERYGPGSEDFWMGSFVWTPDQKDAVYAEAGMSNVNGTDHEAPAAKLCGACHRGEPGRLLGLAAIQLSHDDDGPANAPGVLGGDGRGKGANLTDLAAAGLLSHPPPAGVTYPVPGDGPTAAALGYMHANCGHCHNPNGTSWPDTQMVMRLEIAERTPLETKMVRSLVGTPLQYWRNPTIKTRLVPGDPDASALLVRMKIRDNRDQMPPLATRHVDPRGIALLTAWISGLVP